MASAMTASSDSKKHAHPVDPSHDGPSFQKVSFWPDALNRKNTTAAARTLPRERKGWRLTMMTSEDHAAQRRDSASVLPSLAAGLSQLSRLSRDVVPAFPSTGTAP
jgi:hypothetical protein